ncbi:MAG: enoyl-CoA hydratase-related protein [Acidimicrobiales bacterium]
MSDPSAAVLVTLDRGWPRSPSTSPNARTPSVPSWSTNSPSALDDAIADSAVRVIVLTNAGNTFCAGADLKDAKPGVAGNSGRTFVEVFEIILGSPKPVIGRIDGHATGGGVGLAAVCDISVMRDDAKIGFTEVRLGVAPAVISVVCLPKMRRADASELFLTGERFTPQRAAKSV